MYVDTHAHLYLKDFKEDMAAIMDRCKKESVNRIYLPNIDSTTIEDLKNLVAQFPDICYGMMGLHPCYVKDNYKEELDIIERELGVGKYHAIGEIGIDLYWDKTFVENQIDAFNIQIDWARDMELPIAIHSRDSLDLTINMVAEKQRGDLKGVFHCFNGNVDQAKKILDLGFMMGIGGVLTFKNSGLDKTILEVPMEGLILETDAPYLSPSPFRGKRNECSYVSLIGQKLAEIKGLTIDEVMNTTTINANNLFNYTPL